jgi:hypothetical protein
VSGTSLTVRRVTLEAVGSAPPTPYGRGVGQTREPTALRRAVLAASLTDHGSLAELETRDVGVVHPGVAGGPPLTLAWSELVTATGDPRGELPLRVAQRRVARWMRLRILLHELTAAGVDSSLSTRAGILSRVRPRALPVDHVLHPGPAWTRRAVMGGALEVGLALRGVDDDGRVDADSVGLLPIVLLVAAGLDAEAAKATADRYLTDMGGLAAERLRRDPSLVLRPLGDADVITLLASRNFRTALVDGQGMRSAAVPMRTRGWLDLSRLDPAFALSAAVLTDPDERGFPRPILVTVDELALARSGGDPVRQALADPAPSEDLRPAAPRF